MEGETRKFRTSYTYICMPIIDCWTIAIKFFRGNKSSKTWMSFYYLECESKHLWHIIVKLAHIQFSWMGLDMCAWYFFGLRFVQKFFMDGITLLFMFSNSPVLFFPNKESSKAIIWAPNSGFRYIWTWLGILRMPYKSNICLAKSIFSIYSPDVFRIIVSFLKSLKLDMAVATIFRNHKTLLIREVAKCG